MESFQICNSQLGEQNVISDALDVGGGGLTKLLTVTSLPRYSVGLVGSPSDRHARSAHPCRCTEQHLVLLANSSRGREGGLDPSSRSMGQDLPTSQKSERTVMQGLQAKQTRLAYRNTVSGNNA